MNPEWLSIGHVSSFSISAPGPNGVPYLLDKRCPNVLKKLHKLLRSAWKNIKISKEWMTVEGVYIPKEQDSKGINQFRPISLLNVEGKIFFSIIASRLTKYLTENGYINISVQKGGIPEVSGCLEHATMIWEAIQSATSEKLNLHVVWLDLANAYGSIPHEMIQLALRVYHVPDDYT
ncbi:reverse transcriptase [Plakobranchus ocellatus]|uniref:Reverse transcriptase n=1 Tax=Plakobranchus ocellatus TaxID=259542 RepID=A0AAV4BKP9_9GAST|nr:reverse transcriptase [Plakobranchus ocellatus]